MLRVLLGEPTGAEEATTVSVIEANIDDLSPEILAYALERLLEAGALDVTLAAHPDEEGPPRHAAARDRAARRTAKTLARLIFAETSTLGLRIYAAERRVQSRRWVEVETPHGKVRMKVSGDGWYAPEYEDCRKLALATGVAAEGQIVAEAIRAYLNESR